MHELSLAGSILKIVEDAAARERFRRVTTLRLEAGRLAGVEPAALRFALDAVARGTCLEGAAIQIDEPAARGFCMACCRSAEITERGQPCPHCGSLQVQTDGGDALRVVDLVVADD
ncbi:MAG: hydrogenase maturation nickel metallochaperone HypA [Rubrivivax sp.]|jgi:hydrogenase nickel incorporation protein HypA/HybF|nr:hydrogenase maturation nickel metallochaperone HypA [Rubrivivax sp.]